MAGTVGGVGATGYATTACDPAADVDAAGVESPRFEGCVRSTAAATAVRRFAAAVFFDFFAGARLAVDAVALWLW